MNRLLIAFVLLCLAFTATPAQAATQIRESAVWYRVHLGTGVDQPVTREEVAEFIDTVITPRFPQGLTVTDASGQWESKEYGLIKERTVVVDIQCPDAEDNAAKIREIAAAYVQKFTRAKASCFIKRIPGIDTILYYQ